MSDTPAKIEPWSLIERTTPNDDMADTVRDRLAAQIKEFEDELAANQEVGVCLAQFGREITFRVLGLGYHNPGLVIFHGEMDDGSVVRLIQHMSQVNLLLVRMAVPAERPARRIGFSDGSE